MLSGVLLADPIAVRFQEGTQHGFLLLRDETGSPIANGEYLQIVHGQRANLRLIFHFRDGSLDQEDTTYIQGKTLRLLTDHHIQKGPSFPHPLDLALNVATGRVISRTVDLDGKSKSDEQQIDLPPDLANGILYCIMLNVAPSATPITVSYLAIVGKPRVVHLLIASAGEQTFTVGGTRRRANDFLVKIQLGGLTGIMAPLVGRQPSPSHFWVLGGDSPALIREEGQLFEGGPVWRIEQVSPTFAATPSVAAAEPAPEPQARANHTTIAKR